MTDETVLRANCGELTHVHEGRTAEIRGWVEATGFRGYNEVEIFSTRYWAMDQGEFLKQILQAYRTKS